jgi:hypothetical protein
MKIFHIFFTEDQVKILKQISPGQIKFVKFFIDFSSLSILKHLL